MTRSSMRIGFAYNEKPSTGFHNRDADLPSHRFSHATPDAFAEWDEPSTIDAVEQALSVFGEVIRLEAVGDFASRLESAGVDLLFNLAEGWAGPSREAHVPAIAEFLGVPYTASNPLTLALALHKGRAKEVFRARDIPTAPFVLIESDADVGALRSMEYPLFLKPAWEGSSKGISQASHSSEPGAAMSRAREMLAAYRQPVIAEEYLPGDEFTVGILGNGADAHALPIVRFRFDALPDGALPINGYEAKWVWDDPAAPLDVLECPARVPESLRQRIADVALAAYRALDCRDWARIDLRLDRGGTPNIVEVNPLPGVMPNRADNSALPRAAEAAGFTYDELIQEVVQIAWRRIAGRELRASPVTGAVA
jgi:D-alanine-D-alanine ligase